MLSEWGKMVRLTRVYNQVTVGPINHGVDRLRALGKRAAETRHGLEPFGNSVRSCKVEYIAATQRR